MRRIATALTVAALAVGLIAAPAAAEEDASLGPIVDAFVEWNNGPGGNDYDILVAIVANDVRIQDVLNGTTTTPGTVLAPSDRAFTSFARELIRKGGPNVDGLRWWQVRSEAQAVDYYVNNGLLGSDVVFNIVAGHVISGVAATSDVVFANRVQSFDTLNGEIKAYKFLRLIKDSSNRLLRVNAPDALVVDGVIAVHGINRVILPSGVL